LNEHHTTQGWIALASETEAQEQQDAQAVATAGAAGPSRNHKRTRDHEQKNSRLISPPLFSIFSFNFDIQCD
jgi:uncharacterized protein YdaU (DUF1376 family)